MSFVTKKCLPRRTFLRSVGVSLALPLLDSMAPALAAAAKPARRLGCIYVPNGVNMLQWTPKTEGANFEFTRPLEPLKLFKDRMFVLSGLADHAAVPRPGEGAGDHARAAGTWLSGVHTKKTEGSDISAGVTLDQLAAQVLGKETQLASLELGLDSVEVVGGCDTGYGCAYTNSISWRTPTTPLPMENDPRAVFERLFGASDSTAQSARLSRLHWDRSILDFVTAEIDGLQTSLGARDRSKLGEYLDAVRDVERRIQIAEAQTNRELPVVDQPAGIPSTFEAHAKLMFDLLALAYQTDLTRVGTFMMGRELSARPYPEIGVPDAHHACSHHQNDPAKLEKLTKIDNYHVSLFAYFLERLQNTPDGDGTLLDHSLFIYGGGISDANIHLHMNLPTLLVGGGSGTITGAGRHIRYTGDPPISNLYVSVLEKLGIPMAKFGDSTGKLDYLSEI